MALPFTRPVIVAAAIMLGAIGITHPATAQLTSYTADTGTPAGVARACPQPPAAGTASCLALVVTGANGRPIARPATGGPPQGVNSYYGPSQLQAAYHLPASSGAGQTVAIIDAYDDPNAEADLAAYRSAYGLPACTTADGCFSKVNQSGHQGHYPAPNAGWALEMSLDMEMVSAACPLCHILLVEANDNTMTSLAAAENTAADADPAAISNSYGASEYPGIRRLERDYDHPGIAITASAGDSGYGVSYPATSSYVTAVGGTTLVHAATSRGWTETAWAEGGSGCSAYIAKPAWQTDRGCPNRTDDDVAADANPNTGVAVYDTYGEGGWLLVGGTSVASPLIASVYALAGNTAAIDNASYIYSHHKQNLWNITAGSNGSCQGSYLCTARKGYNGPTGWGTPNGTGAF